MAHRDGISPEQPEISRSVFAGRNDIKHASPLGFQRRFSAVSARPLSVRYGCHVHSHPMLRKTWRKGSGLLGRAAFSRTGGSYEAREDAGEAAAAVTMWNGGTAHAETGVWGDKAVQNGIIWQFPTASPMPRPCNDPFGIPG